MLPTCFLFALAYLVSIDSLLPDIVYTFIQGPSQNVDQRPRQKAHPRQSHSIACTSKEARPPARETIKQTRRSRSSSKSPSSKSSRNQSASIQSTRSNSSQSQSARSPRRSQARTSQSGQLDQSYSAGRRGERGKLCWGAGGWSWEQCEWYWDGDWE